LNNPEFLYWAV